MAILTRDQILKADDLPKKKISIPKWGGDVFVRGLTSKERDTYEFENYKKIEQGLSGQSLRVKLVILAVVDENGKNIFTDKDIAILEGKSGEVVTMLFDEIRKLSGLTYAEVDEEAKN